MPARTAGRAEVAPGTRPPKQQLRTHQRHQLLAASAASIDYLPSKQIAGAWPAACSHRSRLSIDFRAEGDLRRRIIPRWLSCIRCILFCRRARTFPRGLHFVSAARRLAVHVCQCAPSDMTDKAVCGRLLHHSHIAKAVENAKCVFPLDSLHPHGDNWPRLVRSLTNALHHAPLVYQRELWF